MYSRLESAKEYHRTNLVQLCRSGSRRMLLVLQTVVEEREQVTSQVNIWLKNPGDGKEVSPVRATPQGGVSRIISSYQMTAFFSYSSGSAPAMA